MLDTHKKRATKMITLLADKYESINFLHFTHVTELFIVINLNSV